MEYYVSHIKHLVNDFLIQISLACRLSRNPNHPNNPFIGVFLARYNLQPFIDEFVAQASLIYVTPPNDLKALAQSLERYNGVRIQIVQKPEPVNGSNHLTLTTGNLTSIIFDYEN